MTANPDAVSEPEFHHGRLSKPNSAWEKVASEQLKLEPLINRLYSLPLEEYRKIPYKAPPLPANVPVPNRDLSIREDTVIVRDGALVKVRIYEPLNRGTGHLLFFNVHGGG